MKVRFFILFTLVFILTSCQFQHRKSQETPIQTYQPEYARFFKIEYFDDYKKIVILNPWQNEELNINYYLSVNESPIEISQNKQSFILNQKIAKVVALSSPMVGLLNLLNLDSTIIGVSDPSYIYNENILRKVKDKTIVNVGKNISVNMETLLSIQPDIVLASGWDKWSPDFERMIQLKITPLLMYDWQEIHPLGKAEWMILLAACFNLEDKAIQQFHELRDRYIQLSNQLSFDKQPTVFNGSEYQGIWYSAGGQSYMSKLYSDAGARYLMKNDSSTGSIMLDFEVIMEKAINTDIWMYTGGVDPASIELFYSSKYQSFKAVRKKKVYSYHQRINENGANDYWETASYKPDIVLHDLIRIFHENEPENLYYFKKLEY